MDKKEALGLYLCQLSNYIWDFGYYIDKRKSGNLTMELYSVDNKYFEMYISPEDQITKISEIDLESITQHYGMEIVWMLSTEYANETN